MPAPRDAPRGRRDEGGELTGDGSRLPEPPLVEGVDYTIEPGGFLVFTAAYLRRRGTCCESGCRHCPYGFAPG